MTTLKPVEQVARDIFNTHSIQETINELIKTQNEMKILKLEQQISFLEHEIIETQVKILKLTQENK
jgi:hypothetical protein